MDWTGGVRRRFASGKSNATLQKQKAHFAKARTTLYNTTGPQLSFKPDFLRPASGSKRSSRRQRQSHLPVHDKRSGSGLRRSNANERQGSVRKHRDKTSRHDFPRYHEEKDTGHSPPIVYVSSSSRSSPLSSKASQQRSKRRRSQSPTAAQSKAMTEEESLLLANRRRLLARPDWLGLAATKPVQMKFPSSRDKERIGKRRKLEKSASRKGQPAGQRLVTPLFEERLWPQEHMMSGALLPDDIQVRIGTDALASQTQRSRRSHTPGKTSVRQPSTEFGPLSEEPMLLGEDGDNFEVLQSPKTARRQAESLDLLRGIQAKSGMRQVPQSPEAYLEIRQPGGNDYVCIGDSRGALDNEGNTFDVVLESEYLYDSSLVAPRMRIESRAPVDTQQELDITVQSQLREQNQNEEAVMFQAGETDDDETWRHLMNIKQYNSSHTSMAALKSSSLHFTTSESSHRPALDVYKECFFDPRATLSTPKGAGTQASIVHHSREIAARDESSLRSQSLQSPSASLQQIVKLAGQPLLTSVRAKAEDNDNALWRQFVCGSQDDSDESLVQLNAREDEHDVVEHQPSHGAGSSSFIVSGLGTSNNTTAGDTLFLGGSTSSAMSEMLTKRKVELSSHRVNDSASPHMWTVAMTATEDHDDSIEEVQTPAATTKQSSNIHASAASILNPNRFKRPQKQQTSFPRPNNLRSSRTAKRSATSKIHSVYDLIDSDGISIVRGEDGSTKLAETHRHM